MKRSIVLVALVALGGCGPSCMSTEGCKNLCAPAGVAYYGPVRGGQTPECLCKGTEPGEKRP